MFFVTLVHLLGTCAARGMYPARDPLHVILMLADDLGWNDVSFNGSPQIPTPNIDALAASGIILKNHYAAPVCTPSRASLMTGMFPSNTGLQHRVLIAGQQYGLPLDFTIMPQYFKELGYKAHGVGKWHLGYSRKEYTPTHRGFDTFFGYWNGEIDHYDYTHYYSKDMYGIDLHFGTEPIKYVRGKFAAYTFTQRAEEIILQHDPSQPLFLYLSQTVPHSANPYQRSQAPPEEVEKFMHIKDINRRIYAGAISTLDHSVGKVFAALYEKGMLDNSIFVFVSDNGAEVEGQRQNYGSNWPLRGAKAHLWEGGVRVPALIWSPLLRLQEPRISTQRMHISDWLPTLYAAAGGNVNDLGNIDGINMWRHLVMDTPSPRNEILLNADPIDDMYSLIRDDFKLIKGSFTSVPSNIRDLWYGPSGREEVQPLSMDEWVWRNGSIVKDILQIDGKWLICEPDKWRQDVTVDCGYPFPPANNGGCNPNTAPCLFNIIQDPCEYDNLADELPEVLEFMVNRIRILNSTSVYPFNLEIDLNADPRCHGFSYVPWLDFQYASEPCGIHSKTQTNHNWSENKKLLYLHRSGK